MSRSNAAMSRQRCEVRGERGGTSRDEGERMRFCLAILAFLAPITAVAEESPPPEPTPLELRRGLHVGGGIGGAYLPLDDGTRAIAARAFVNWGRGRHEDRFGVIAYHASSPNQSTTGAVLVLEDRLYIGEAYAFGAGIAFGYHDADRDNGDDGGTRVVGVTLAPIAIKLGPKRNVELAIEGLIFRQIDLETQTYGAFVSATYLKL
jgi:hypothetical protein